jgi:hypothetical protein
VPSSAATIARRINNLCVQRTGDAIEISLSWQVWWQRPDRVSGSPDAGRGATTAGIRNGDDGPQARAQSESSLHNLPNRCCHAVMRCAPKAESRVGAK